MQEFIILYIIILDPVKTGQMIDVHKAIAEEETKQNELVAEKRQKAKKAGQRGPQPKSSKKVGRPKKTSTESSQSTSSLEQPTQSTPATTASAGQQAVLPVAAGAQVAGQVHNNDVVTSQADPEPYVPSASAMSKYMYSR